MKVERVERIRFDYGPVSLDLTSLLHLTLLHFHNPSTITIDWQTGIGPGLLFSSHIASQRALAPRKGVKPRRRLAERGRKDQGKIIGYGTRPRNTGPS